MIASGKPASGWEEPLGHAVARAPRRPSDLRSTHPLEEAAVELAGRGHVALLLKGSGWADTSRVRPRLVRDQDRESWAYGRVLDPAALGTPRFHGVLDPGGRGERLVLERVPGRPLSEVGDPQAWAAAARWLSAFHAWGRCRIGRLEGPEDRFLHQSPDLHRRWWARASRRAEAAGRTDSLRRLGQLQSTYELAVRLLAESPRTILHGEFYPSNIIAERDGDGWRIHPIDWESIGLGPIWLDLAALASGDWTAADRERITAAYTDAHVPGSSTAIRRGLAAAALVNAMQWLGWTASWSPPPEHARDWLAEAQGAARRFAAETGT